MKAIQVTVKQTGCGFIGDSHISIKIDDREVENNTYKVVWEALEVAPFKKYDYNYYGGALTMVLKAPNGNKKQFEVPIPRRCYVEDWEEEKIKEYFYKIKDFIEGVEDWVNENSNCFREFSFEI